MGRTTSHKGAFRAPRALWAFGLLALLLVCTQLVACSKLDEASLSATRPLVASVLDVGQGDSILLGLPDGSFVLVDGGDYNAGSSIAEQLNTHGAKHLRAIVATHPHADHIGGLSDVMDSCDVDEVWQPDVDPGTATSRDFAEAVQRENAVTHTCAVGDVVAQGEGFSIRCLWPPIEATFEDLNDYSAILLVTCGERSLLLTGDAHASIIEEACQDAGVDHVDVLKAAHHGSETGTTSQLLRSLNPDAVVISYGSDNPYGHPDAKVLEALNASGIPYYGTAAQGELTVHLGPSTMDVAPEHEGTVVAGEYPEDYVVAQQEASSAAEALNAGAEAEQRGDADVVYVTPTGSRYHLRDCSRLSDDVIPLLREDAVAAGYTPCGTCHPN